MKRTNKKGEVLTGVAIGLILAILFFSKLTFAATVENEPQRWHVNGSVTINCKY